MYLDVSYIVIHNCEILNIKFIYVCVCISFWISANHQTPRCYNKLVEIEDTDIKKRKLLTMLGGFHLKFNTLRLYMKRKEGGWGLVKVRTTMHDETIKITEYAQQDTANWIPQAAENKWGTTSGTIMAGHSCHHHIEVTDIRTAYQWLEKAGLKDKSPDHGSIRPGS